MKNLVLFFSGRGSNMRAILEAVHGGRLEGIAKVPFVLTNKPDAGGIAVAEEFGIETRVIPSKGVPRDEYDQRVLRSISDTPIDVIALAGYMRILSAAFISAYRGRIVNVHPADTAAHQGTGGYAWAFEQKLPETWITVHVVDEGLDTGPVLRKARVDLSGATTLAEVEARGLAVEHRVYSEALRDFLESGNRGIEACAAS
ncbi:MAG: formyltransferase family protein [Polyangiaceae bacterium]